MAADSPARALVIYGDGLFPLPPSHPFPHLHALAASGSCGFLALRNLPPGVTEAQRIVFELAQLLDVTGASSNEAKAADGSSSISTFLGVDDCGPNGISSISERFMGMKVAMVTNLKPAASLGKRLGCSVMMLKDIDNMADEETGKLSPIKTISELPNPLRMASRLLGLLGLCDTASKDTFELVLLHVGATCANDHNIFQVPLTPEDGLSWINDLVGQIKCHMLPGTSAARHLYLALVLGYGAVSAKEGTEPVSATEGTEPGEQIPSLRLAEEGLEPKLAALRPQQTYRQKNGCAINDIREHHPLLVVHQMDAVTRRDEVRSLGFEEFHKDGGNLTILADRFLHEVAFKLWRAPKYGA